MGVTSYKVEVSPGVKKKFYLVVAEGINKYTGKRVQKKSRGITSKAKAERRYRELWNQCREERPDGLEISRWGQLRICYQEFIEANIRSAENPNGYSPHTVGTKKSRFLYLKHWDELHIELFDAHFVTSELDKLESSGVVSRRLTSDIQKEVKCLFAFAFDKGIIKANSISNLKKRKVPRKRKEALTHDEANKLLGEASARNHPYFFIWLLSLSLGLRRSELAGLKWLDIDFEHRLAHLRRQRLPKEGVIEKLKSGVDRTVAIPASVLPILKEYRLRSKSEYVIDVSCRKWESGNQSEVLRAFCREIGIKEVTHHQLRATHITLALIDGVPLGIIKENVGHSKLSTTDVYFRSSGILMSGKTDGLKLKVPRGKNGKVLKIDAK